MTGKLSSSELSANVLDVIKRRRSEVKMSAAIGEDCAVLSANGLMLVTSDPITGACRNIGRLAIYVATNDVYAGGGEPFAVFLTIIVPEKTDVSEIRAIMSDAEDAAERLNVEIAGGHTEYSDSVNRPIINCTAIGKTVCDKVFSCLNIKCGDSILMTATAAREFTAIAVADDEETAGLLNEKELQEAQSYVDVSIAKPAKLCAHLPVSAMHDATEGGLIGAIDEMMNRVGMCCKLQTKNIPISAVTRKVCRALNVDPLRQLASGSLLIATRFPKEIIKELKRINIDAIKIGEVVEGNGVQLV